MLPDTVEAATSALGFGAHGACSFFSFAEDLPEAVHTNLMPASHLYGGLGCTDAYEALFGIWHLREYKVPVDHGTIHAEPVVAIQYPAGY